MAAVCWARENETWKLWDRPPKGVENVGAVGGGEWAEGAYWRGGGGRRAGSGGVLREKMGLGMNLGGGDGGGVGATAQPGGAPATLEAESGAAEATGNGGNQPVMRVEPEDA